MIVEQGKDGPAVDRVGPILYARGGDGHRNRLAALVVRPETDEPPPLHVGEEGVAIKPRPIATLFGVVVWRYDFSLPAGRPAAYRLGGERFEIAPPDDPGVRIAYVSCNGQEHGDLDRGVGERDAMWSRLVEEHGRAPFALMLQGGDQLYADDVLSAHEVVRRWSERPKRQRADIAFTDDVREAVRRFYFRRYLTTFARPAMRTLAARIPSIMMWDDHDIFDGWGSHPEPLLDSPVGLGLFAAAREMFLLFQLAANEGAMPDIAFDRSGRTLGVAVRYPGLSILAPDLRSERRPDRVMGDAGWSGFERAMAATPDGEAILLMSSVPALGPRLSWVEAVADIVPKIRELEDDLRDQWQSRAHREEWKRFLRLIAERQEGHRGCITVVSGEIHLATRGEMRLKDGSTLHQLVASGISHPAPRDFYPMMLGLLARVGESPLPKRKIRLRPLPSQRAIYTAERNYLVLTLVDASWTVQWELEDSGRTPLLSL
ncbi:alkaline phosphatase D family protein [Aurantimonas marina]|uniref:alkaline phosphatase D family protein n=1 Tax=Aurantimonas marina TaxID=2780508 RepID=UPI0019D099A7|nr:alkaline phosphatase D family protein [Aurantimonas marina]